MARFVTGNTFGTTDTVTAAKLNTAVNDAAISTDSVDGSTIEINSNALRIKDSGVTFAKLTDVIDDDTMATASSTKIATSESIKAYVTAMRPKFVTLTGGTTDLTKTTASVSTVDYTYNIADFTSSDSDFATSKIVALIVQGFTSSSQNQNNVQARLPDDNFTVICSTSATGTADFTEDHGTSNIPINSGQSSIVIKHGVNDAQTTAAQSTIQGAIIHPGL